MQQTAAAATSKWASVSAGADGGAGAASAAQEAPLQGPAASAAAAGAADTGAAAPDVEGAAAEPHLPALDRAAPGHSSASGSVGAADDHAVGSGAQSAAAAAADEIVDLTASPEGGAGDADLPGMEGAARGTAAAAADGGTRCLGMGVDLGERHLGLCVAEVFGARAQPAVHVLHMELVDLNPAGAALATDALVENMLAMLDDRALLDEQRWRGKAVSVVCIERQVGSNPKMCSLSHALQGYCQAKRRTPVVFVSIRHKKKLAEQWVGWFAQTVQWPKDPHKVNKHAAVLIAQKLLAEADQLSLLDDIASAAHPSQHPPAQSLAQLSRSSSSSSAASAASAAAAAPAATAPAAAAVAPAGPAVAAPASAAKRTRSKRARVAPSTRPKLDDVCDALLLLAFWYREQRESSAKA